MAVTGRRGVDVAVDVTGTGAAQNAAIDSTRPMGTMVFIGVGGETTISPFRQLIAKDLNVFGSYTYKLGEFEDMTRFLLRHRLDFSRIVGATYTPQEAEQAFRDAVSTAKGKILFDWSGVSSPTLPMAAEVGAGAA
jgi:threonine dehydrogenase-like Zn-dependent dehydrogenase